MRILLGLLPDFRPGESPQGAIEGEVRPKPALSARVLSKQATAFTSSARRCRQSPTIETRDTSASEGVVTRAGSGGNT